MHKFTLAEALVCLGLTAALFFSGGPAARLLDLDFYRETQAKASTCSLAYQVLGHHVEAPKFSIKYQGEPAKPAPVSQAQAKAKLIGRKVWSTVTGPFRRPLDATEAR